MLTLLSNLVITSTIPCLKPYDCRLVKSLLLCLPISPFDGSIASSLRQALYVFNYATRPNSSLFNLLTIWNLVMCSIFYDAMVLLFYHLLSPSQFPSLQYRYHFYWSVLGWWNSLDLDGPWGLSGTWWTFVNFFLIVFYCLLPHLFLELDYFLWYLYFNALS